MFQKAVTSDLRGITHPSVFKCVKLEYHGEITHKSDIHGETYEKHGLSHLSQL